MIKELERIAMKREGRREEELKQHYQSKGIGIGIAIFMPIGMVLSMLLDNPGMLGLGPAIGISIGVAIGEALYKKEVLGE